MRLRDRMGTGLVAIGAAVALTAGAAGTAAGPAVDGVDPLAAVPPGSVPAIPASGVPLGGAVTLLDGVQVESADQTTIHKSTQVETPSGRLEVSGFSASGRRLGLSPGADAFEALTVAPGGRVEGRVTGVRPDAAIAVHLLGAASARQDTTANAAGVAEPVLAVPADFPTGPATLQVNAVTATGVVQSVSWGVLVARDQAPVTAPRLPGRLRDAGWTRLVREPLRTNAGQRVRVIVLCADAAYRDPPSRRGPCRVDKDRRGWTRVGLFGTKAVRVLVALRAPATDGYLPYVSNTRYRSTAVR